jgi:hypothetical protein
MAFESEFLTMMETVAIYYPFATNSGYGDPSFGTPVNFRCHVTYKRKILRGDTDQDVTSTAQIQMPPGGYVVNGVATPTVSIDDRITLPFDGIQRKVLDVISYTDGGTGFNGVHHQTLSIE